MATGHLEANPAPLAQCITLGLTKIYLALRSQTWKTSGARKVAPAQGQILLFLRSHPHQAPTVSDIAENLTVTSGSASQAVRGLARNGLVKKSRSGPDARCVTLALTAKGRRRADRTLQWSDFLARATETLTLHEQESLLGALLRILLALQKTGEIPALRMCPTCRHFRPNVHDDPDQPHHCTMLDAPFGDGLLRIDCPVHNPVSPETRMANRPRELLDGRVPVPQTSKLP